MRKIEKGLEPREWTEYCATPGVDFDAISELVDALLEEQGYVCAYCSRRIPCKDPGIPEKQHIEHIKCRRDHHHLKRNYKNLVACCPGAIDNNYHCDRLKDNSEITFSLFTDAFYNTLSYDSADGSIRSSNLEWDREINDILNLNHKRIRKNRLSALDTFISCMGREGWKNVKKREQIEKWNSKDSNGKYSPYGGIVLWYLKKNLRRPE